ncbi:hypothetical protein SAMN06298216_0509 [Spirosomataceae bacterium TFI 002]|nr:hypothetical protein SAMN06298216_0509 [Spirosomataceae bacterium TFI 002]
MSKIEKLSFIEGAFEQEDVKDILMNAFSSKIKFHQMKNFSSQERLGKDDAIAVKRIPELQNEVERLNKILAEAKSKGTKLKISSVIEISFS